MHNVTEYVPRAMWEEVRRNQSHGLRAVIILEGGEDKALGLGVYPLEETAAAFHTAAQTCAAIAILFDSLPDGHHSKLTHETRAALSEVIGYSVDGLYKSPALAELHRLVVFLDAILPPPELPPVASLGPTIGAESRRIPDGSTLPVAGPAAEKWSGDDAEWLAYLHKASAEPLRESDLNALRSMVKYPNPNNRLVDLAWVAGLLASLDAERHTTRGGDYPKERTE